MKRQILVGVVLVALLGGCAANPRYRTGGGGRPAPAMQSRAGLTTNDYIRLAAILQSYLGRPYRGRSLFLPGIDCSLFVREAFKQFNGTELPRTVDGQYRMGREIAYRRLLFGDLVFFRTEKHRVSHVGVYVGRGQFIHASTSRGVVITDLNDKYWAKRYAGARRVL